MWEREGGREGGRGPRTRYHRALPFNATTFISTRRLTLQPLHAAIVGCGSDRASLGEDLSSSVQPPAFTTHNTLPAPPLCSGKGPGLGEPGEDLVKVATAALSVAVAREELLEPRPHPGLLGFVTVQWSLALFLHKRAVP